MRKIQFNEETIEQIRIFVEEGHTIQETCNKFTLKQDTLRRVLFENDIKPISRYSDRNRKCTLVYDDIPESVIQEVCNLYSTTEISMADICKTVKLSNFMVQVILDKHFTQEYRDGRKAKLYRKSKLGELNPMSGKCGKNHHNYKGLIEDGNGYYMILKPDWYTSKKGKYIFYHHYVMCKALNLTEIPKGYVVHHIDYNKKNNDISNLALMTISAHSRLHQLEKKMQGAETIHKGVGIKPETPNNNRY